MRCPKSRFPIRIIVFDKLELIIFVSQGLTLSTASLVRILLYLVDVAHNHWGEEDLREGDGHRVHGGHHGGVHEVYGVAVEENSSASHCHAHDYRPENVLETWKYNYWLAIITKSEKIMNSAYIFCLLRFRSP